MSSMKRNAARPLLDGGSRSSPRTPLPALSRWGASVRLKRPFAASLRSFVRLGWPVGGL